MRWDEYVEEATAKIPSRAVARNVRRELRDHLESTTEALIGTGTAQDVAEVEAMRRLGPVEVLGAEFRLRYRTGAPTWPATVLLAGLLVGAISLGFQSTGPAILLIVWSLVWGALHPKSIVSLWYTVWYTPIAILSKRQFLSRLDRVRPFVTAGAVAGICVVATIVLTPLNAPLILFVSLGLAVGAWYRAVRSLDPQDDDMVFPFGSGIATGALVVVGLFGTGILNPGTAGYVLVMAAGYFSVTNGLWRLYLSRQRLAEGREVSLAVEGGQGLGALSPAPPGDTPVTHLTVSDASDVALHLDLDDPPSSPETGSVG